MACGCKWTPPLQLLDPHGHPEKNDTLAMRGCSRGSGISNLKNIHYKHPVLGSGQKGSVRRGSVKN